jgi:hypothetical protein
VANLAIELAHVLAAVGHHDDNHPADPETTSAAGAGTGHSPPS